MTISVKNSAGADTTISTIDDLLPLIATSNTSLTSILAKIIVAPATEAKQDTANTSLASINTKLSSDPATQTTLAALVAKVIAAPATEAKQDAGNTSLASILSKIIVAPATEAKQDTGNTSLASILAKIIVAPATEAKQDALTTIIGAVTASPTSNTLLARLKDILTLTSLANSENHIGSIGGNTSYIDVTLTLGTSVYAANALLADTQPITGAMRVNGGTGILQSISVVDQDDQKSDLRIFLLSANTSFGTENASPSITDAGAVDILGAPILISVLDYYDLGGVSIAGKDNIGKIVKAATGTTAVYVAVINGAGTPTYTASGIKLRLGFLQD